MYITFKKKNAYANFLLREIIKMLVEMRIIKVLLLVVSAKVKIKMMKQSNQRYIDPIYLLTLLTKNKLALFFIIF